MRGSRGIVEVSTARSSRQSRAVWDSRSRYALIGYLLRRLSASLLEVSSSLTLLRCLTSMQGAVRCRLEKNHTCMSRRSAAPLTIRHLCRLPFVERGDRESGAMWKTTNMMAWGLECSLLKSEVSQSTESSEPDEKTHTDAIPPVAR